MQVYVETSLNNISPEEWDALAAVSPTHTVFQTNAWHRAWWQTIREGQDLFLICVKENNQLIGIGPFFISRKGKLKILKFMGTGQADYCDFLYSDRRPDILKEMFGFLAQHKDRWDAAALDYIPEESFSTMKLPQECAALSLFCRQYAQHKCPTLIFDQHKNNVREVLDKKSLKRHAHYFEKKGGYSVKHLTDAASINPYLNTFFEQHIQRRQTAGTSSLFLDPKNKEFYRKLVEHLSRQGSIVFTVIESEGDAIAFHFGFLFGERFIWYKPSFNPAFAKHSPGEVLLKELLTFVLTQDCREFDFTIGDEAFKTRFSNEVRKNNSYKLFQSRSHALVDQAMSTAKQWVKQ